MTARARYHRTVRRVGVAAIALVALTSLPAVAQPRPPGWKTAFSAALAFGHAEGKAAALAAYRIAAAPTTKKAADAALDELDHRASEARDAFSVVEKFGSPFWSAAASLRIGDMFVCQANLIVLIPLPLQVTQGMPPKVLAQYLDVMNGLVQPLRDQAIHYWEAASVETSPYWAAHARDRLAGGAVPGC